MGVIAHANTLAVSAMVCKKGEFEECFIMVRKVSKGVRAKEVRTGNAASCCSRLQVVCKLRKNEGCYIDVLQRYKRRSSTCLPASCYQPWRTSLPVCHRSAHCHAPKRRRDATTYHSSTICLG
ncbi:uncharacterized protein LOC119437017 [Dermacentor silvarum]|uniref:uncharacterized protein LOC119437017 n=1 Tax=Dermacentor silvarum TaxID=543639 RepID=UPI002100FA77|nr:uncharacterized protein LOC119437017 [Dermacentor silvarum]